ncbi:MAG TPA: L,D-transpeptidase [Anaerolineae bacterium]|nr:L,D-transpeptidase [Anaerolineae bacterium]
MIHKSNNRRGAVMRRKLFIFVVLIAVVLVAVALLWLNKESQGHLGDYLIWRWMATFKQPVMPVDDYRVLVTKADRLLQVYRAGELIAQYPVAISRHGTGKRQNWEDELTPEGEFRIASMQYQSRFGPRQMLLDTTVHSLADYAAQYGETGRSRLTTWEQQHGPLDTIWEVYDFNEANPAHPIWNDILIHGGGTDRDWTWGCIALDNNDLIALFETLQQSSQRGLGVAVEIRPK